MTISQPSSSQWVENALASLLSSPHISIPHRPGGIIGGPGPIDLFSTRFSNTFTTDATGVVDGEQVDRQGLKEKLLALQTHYNPDTVKFQEEPATYGQGNSGEVFVSFTWTSKDTVEHHISTAATVVKQGEVEKISSLALKGKPDLFVKSDTA